jgi:hypothetical protein
MRIDEVQASDDVGTAAGLFGVWRDSAFRRITELDAWDGQVAGDRPWPATSRRVRSSR